MDSPVTLPTKELVSETQNLQISKSPEMQPHQTIENTKMDSQELKTVSVNDTTKKEEQIQPIITPNVFSSRIPTNEQDPKKAVELRLKGNQAWKAGDIQTAILSYSEAIDHLPNSAELYRNRSAALTVTKEWKQAISDADIAISLDPCSKSHCRKAEAYFNLGIHTRDPLMLEHAVKSFMDAYSIDEAKQVKSAAEQTSYYLTHMRAEKALQLSKAKKLAEEIK
eukprot:TRINITY_DN15136_c0_g1_i1.p1 TRINITY_DN15136_c0_g1~~TRINITY_DN15136_c0_g1_i1.p1  ORF type:complete len:253 (-),score=56.08 TRINITY_DN15136_c0_g1_i1:62-733(-)